MTKTTNPDLPRAYTDGWESYSNGGENPYDTDTAAWFDWEQGFIDADEFAQKSVN